MTKLIYTTTQLRQNMADIFYQVLNGQEVAVILGRGKKAKRIRLSIDKSEPSSNTKKNAFPKNFRHRKMQEILQSDQLKLVNVEEAIYKTDNPKKYLMEKYFKEKS